MLPSGWSRTVAKATRVSLEKALMVSLQTLDTSARPIMPQNFFYKGLVVVSGAVGGFWGLPALAIELPLSTCVMLRSIADIARNQGEQLQTRDAQLACIQVLALGGRSDKDDANESAYFMLRAALAKSVTEALGYVTGRGAIEESAPVLIRLIAQISVMVTALRYQYGFVFYAIHQAMTMVDTTRPKAGQLMFKRLRFTDTGERATSNIAD
jgi:hypothetical protein